MAQDKRRASSTGHKTLNSVTFEKNNIDDVISDISLNTKLKYIKVATESSNLSGHSINLERDGLVIHIADIILRGDKYLALFDPSDDYQGFSKEEITSVYQELRGIFLKYAQERVRNYLERTNLENS